MGKKDFASPMDRALNSNKKEKEKEKEIEMEIKIKDDRIGKKTKHSTIMRIRKTSIKKLEKFLDDKDITKKDLVEALIEIFLAEPEIFRKRIRRMLGTIKAGIIYSKGNLKI